MSHTHTLSLSKRVLSSSTDRKFYPITFVGSILWIGSFSYLMVWWATLLGDAFGIPPEVRAS